MGAALAGLVLGYMTLAVIVLTTMVWIAAVGGVAASSAPGY